MLIYLADLAHNYYPSMGTVPLNIAYIAAYAKKRFGQEVEVRLFKCPETLLKATAREMPHLLGLSSYTWNMSLNGFVAQRIRNIHDELPIVMGGPNIRFDNAGIEAWLRRNPYVDTYITFEAEKPFATLVERILGQGGVDNLSRKEFRQQDVDGCFSMIDGTLRGRHAMDKDKDLDYIPSPYTTGILDDFLTPKFIPLFESNRGCPYACSFCNWGIAARKKIKLFSLDRVYEDLEYVAKRGVVFPVWLFVDANYGILPRDVDISRKLRALYEEYHPYHKLLVWWEKRANDRIIDIAKILQGLSDAYVAFQTFDEKVANMIDRTNISFSRLKRVSDALSAITERYRTQVLLGLPGETKESHLNSLRTALGYGFDYIGGGEIRLLEGSDLETEKSRRDFGFKTKYRLVQEGFGIYDGEFVADFEESIRSTNWIAEEEMLHLRVIRAILYGIMTVGELTPLIKYLLSQGVDIIDLLQQLVDEKEHDPIVSESIGWLQDKAASEWFDSPEAGHDFYSDPKNQKALLDNPAVMLNYDFLSFLILSPERHRAFYRHVGHILGHCSHKCDPDITGDLLRMCAERNYIAHCLSGNDEKRSVTIPMAKKSAKTLAAIHFLPTSQADSSEVNLEIEPSLADAISGFLQKNKPAIQTISMAVQKFGRVYLCPVEATPDK